jgi:O-antigen ligase
MIEIGGRGISITVYKLLFVVLVILYAVDPLRRSIKNKAGVNRQLYRLIVAFVVVQTIASLLGNLVTPGDISLPSEIYYLIQRSNFLFIPLFALRYSISPKSVLRLFMGAILIHYLFIALQFVSPRVYASFVEHVFNPIRPDNSLGWNAQSWDFIGLQRTSNYGAFAASFGLLALAFTPKSLSGKFLTRAVVFLSILVAFVGPSRSVLIMVVIAVLIFSRRTKILSRISTYILAVMVIGAFLLGVLRLENLTAINAFFDPEREGSNVGKLAIAQYGLQLFVQSPIVGWGQRRFSDISLPLGNDSFYMSETHSYGLSTLLSSGIIGLIVYGVILVGIARTLWQRKEKDYVIICAMFIGLTIYNVIYDAGSLDVFACFNGIAVYYALRSPEPCIANISATLIEHSKVES